MVYLKELTIDGCGHYGIAAPAVKKKEYLYTYLRITDINDDGTLNKNSLMSVDSPNAFKYILKPNDIVFARTGASTGRNYFYDFRDGQLVYAGFLIKFSIDSNKVNPLFIKYYCQSKKYWDWINIYNSGSTRGNINAQTLGNMKIDLPSREQQNFLVKILYSIDEKIRLNQKINDNLFEQTKTIFEKYFPNINNGSDIIGKIIIPKRGKNLLSKDAILGNIPVIAGGIEPSIYHNKANTIPPVLTISASGANAGYINLWNCAVWSSDSSFIDSSMTSNVYFWYILLKNRQQEIFDAQTGSAQPHIYPKHIAELKINIPSKETIENFTFVVTPFFELISKNLFENDKLSRLRNSILPKLISGNISIDNLKI